jgi:hypothetical protein
MRSRRLIPLLASSAAILTGCAAGAGAAENPVRGAAAASCAAQTNAQQFARARLVVIATALSGPTLRTGSRRVLVSPARMHLIRYLKGHVPKILPVRTAFTVHGRTVSGSGECISPSAGERWKLYLSGRRSPYQTSVCAGSRRVAD